MAEKNYRPATVAAQASGWADEDGAAPGGAISPSLHPSTTFLRRPAGPSPSRFSYARDTNPSYEQPERLLAELEGGVEALLFGSGMAAATAILLALEPGARVLAPQVMYWGLRQWLSEAHRAGTLQVEFLPNGDLTALAAALQDGRTPTRLVWLETPANPSWEITDIAAAADLAHRAGALVAVDSTVATPVLTRPLRLGADLAMHSASKYLNGHSDVIAGAVVTAAVNPFWQRLRQVRQGNGAVLGSFEAWLLLRGMRTLFLRVRAACASAAKLAAALDDQPGVQVLYPGLKHHPGHAVAARQMDGGFGAMLSLRVGGGAERAQAVADRTRLWKQATSLGGVESLIEHRAAVEGPDSPVADDLLRLSVGVEDADDLLADLCQALAR